MIAFSATPFYCTTTKTCRPFLTLQYPFWPFQYPYTCEYASMDHSNCSSCISLWWRQLFVVLRSLSRITRGLVSCPRNSRYIVAIKMGRRQGGPSRTGGRREHI